LSDIIFIPPTSDPAYLEEGIDFFETINRNKKSYPATYSYSGKNLSTIVYDLGNGFSITKTFAYTGNDLTSITLSGDLPPGVATVKTFAYTNKNLTSINYT
jgi:hypothetical protein